MADTAAKSLSADDILKTARTVIDPIEGFFDGLMQIFMEMVKDRKVRDLILLLAGGTIAGSVFLSRLESLIKEDTGEREIARQMARSKYLALIEKFARGGKKDAADGAKWISAQLKAAWEAVSAKINERAEKDRADGDHLVNVANNLLVGTRLGKLGFQWPTPAQLTSVPEPITPAPADGR